MVAWLVTGVTGQVGSNIVAELSRCPDNVVVALHSGRNALNVPKIASKVSFACPVHYAAIDFAKPPEAWEQALRELLETYCVTHVVHCAAVTNVQSAFENRDLAHTINVVATRAIAAMCCSEHTNLRCKVFIHCSTDMVFDGKGPAKQHNAQVGSFYDEESPVAPLSVYGLTKVNAEKAVIDVAEKRYSSAASSDARKCQCIIVRLPLMFGLAYLPGASLSASTFANQLRQLVQREASCRGFVDEYRTPLSFRSAARQLILIGTTAAESTRVPTLVPSTALLFHVSGLERVSRIELLLRMKAALANALLGNELLLDSVDEEVTGSDLVAALGLEVPESPESSPTDSSPTFKLRELGNIVLCADVVEAQRNSTGAPEERPEDLSLSTDKLAAWLAANGAAYQPPTLGDDLCEALQLWVQLL